MKRTFVKAKLFGLCAVAVLGMGSCVDNDYDLSKDIDMNVTVGGDLSVSGNSTEKITLEKIFEIDENCIVQADPTTGDYVLVKEASNSTSEFLVKDVDVEGDEIDVEKAQFDLVFNQVPSDVNISDLEVPFEKAAAFQIVKGNVTEELLKLNWTELNSVSSMKLKFSGSQQVGQLGIRKGMRMTLPDFVTLVSTDDRCQIVDGHILETTTDILLDKYASMSFDVSIVKMDFTDTPDQGLVEIGKLQINDEVKFEGKAFIANGHLDEGNVEVHLEADLDIMSISMTKVNAQVDPKIDVELTNIEIDNLPDFLQDEEVRIRLTDPRVFLTVTNESPISVNLQAEMIPVKDGQQLTDRKLVIGHATDKKHQIIIPGNVKNYVICIHQLESQEGIEADAFTVVPGMDRLVERIPDEIMITNSVANALPEDVTIQMGTTYNVFTMAEVNAPLQFNEGTEVVYTDTMADWSDDIKDIDIKKALVTLDATNTAPMDMTVSADAIDRNGEVIPGVKAVVTGTIAAGLSDSPATSKLQVELTAAEGTFRELDGIKYRVAAVTDKKYNGVNLNANQMVQFDHITIKVIGGVHVDLN